MNEVALFDADHPPRARHSDPSTSHEAAETVSPGNRALIRAIRTFVMAYGPATAWEIADAVANDRWQADTVRSACGRAGLVKVSGGKSPGGRNCVKYALPVEPVVTNAGVL